MTPEDFREALCRFGDHPDRIAELRKVAVGLAIAGHWKAGADMRCAADLAGAIEAKKASLVGAGAISKPKTYLPVRPYDLPDVFKNSSTFVPLGQIARIEKGQTGIKQAVPGDYPLVVTAAKRASCDHFDFEGAAAVIPLVSATGHGNASINRLHYQEGKFALGTILAAVFPYAPEIISARFLFEYLSTFKDELLVSRMTGTANVTLTIGSIAEVPVPLISPEVQGQLDAFMALCDQLETARAEREAGRDRLTAATLARLNAPDPETFPADARFALDNLTPLTTRPDQIKQLRQTILNLAVRGQLVKQREGDEPAAEALGRIKDDVAELAVGIGLKAPRALDAVAEADAPFQLPIGWAWARFPELGAFGRGRSKHRPRNDPALYNGGEHLMVQTGDVARSSGEILTFTAKYNDIGLSQSRLWPKGTLCITIAANIADTGILGFPACFPDSVVGFVPVQDFENARYFDYFMKTAKADLLEFAPATAQKNINLDILTQVLIPLPPLAEQRRIVAKVDELMALCDQLGSSLTDNEQTRSRLLESVLHNALEPA
jgi:type I restriction enzyme S subunit